MRCLYVRVSTEAQAEEGFSIEAQKQRLQAFCVSKDWENYEFYVDAGFSGSNLERPAMNNMISHIESGIVDSVLVYKLDRLSRSQKDTLYLIEDVFLPRNVDFISLNESIDTSTPYGRAMIGILSAFAQLERENIYLRTRMGMVERVKQGFWMGGGTIPFGYDYDKEQGILVPNPFESQQVQQIYQLYLQGMSPQKIAEKLGLAYDRLVTQIIDRRTNLGYINYKGKEYQGKHQAIIGEEIFDLAQEKRKKRQVSRNSEEIHLLSGLIYCGNCGNRMRYVRWGKNGYKLRCYSQDKSKSYMNAGKKCQEKGIWALDVEEIVERDLLEISCRLETQMLVIPLTHIKEEIAQSEGKLRRLYQLYANDGDKTLKKLIEDSKNRLIKLELTLKEEMETQKKAEEMKRIQNRVCSLGEFWNDLEKKEKREIFRDCIEKITIKSENVQIFYRFILEETALDF